MKTEAELKEQVFKKMGWNGQDGLWVGPLGKHSVLRGLPPIDSQWEVTAKYLVPFMMEKGWDYDIMYAKEFRWCHTDHDRLKAEIKDDNIAEAACKAFMEVEL